MDQKAHLRYLPREEKLLELEENNGLIIKDREFVSSLIEEIGFDALIGSYRSYFVDPANSKYVIPTTFEDIYALYVLDEGLMENATHDLARFESKIRQIIAFSFVELYGDNQNAYLDSANYNPKSKNDMKELGKLFVTLSKAAMGNTSHNFLLSQKRAHKNVPLEMAMRIFSFGQLSIFYNLLHPALQNKIAKFFPDVDREDLGRYLRCLNIFRNICAHHSENLFSFRFTIDFPDKPVHQALGIKKTDRTYEFGKKDYFGSMIAFKYLLTDKEFFEYAYKVMLLIDKYFFNSKRLKDELFDLLGFPPNWLDILVVSK